MTSRELLDVKSHLRGPLWECLQGFLEARKQFHLNDLDSQIDQLGDLFNRERSIGARRELTEIIEKFPDHVETLLQQKLREENET